MIKWIIFGGGFVLLVIIALGNVIPWIRIGNRIDRMGNKAEESESEVA